MRFRKGISPIISYVLVLGIVLSAVGITMNYGMPLLDEMEDTAAVEHAISKLTELDSTIKQVAAGGTYTTRSFSLRHSRGDFKFDNESNEIYYEIETSSDIISSHSSKDIGPVTLSSGTGVELYGTDINGTDCYMMENKYLKACIKNITQGSQVSTSELLVYYYNKKLEREETPELNVEINEVDSTSKGTGYTFPEQIGRTLGKGRVTANIETDYGINYSIHFELLTGSDFLSIKVE